MRTRKFTLTLVAASTLWMSSCQQPPRRTEARPGDPDTAAGKAGKLVYKVEKETEKAAKEATRKIDQAARDAHAGYKDAERKTDK